ncbi:LysR family transcriptional regulator [Goodfellowiella coeruleoviolacea]|uniref:DNA-binding transcriptional regulator, LysR family n=1 Tax=Goodfellowiella coeruleoviolacea TaxID=334858 RepID=A0AAE3KK50_9PSEU|nr:LysR family transcriptional regulator [Goodfellowiella coeruleoviolacea]MCP2169009.1 DNA-binding transcriptional regulator, LysR family [Goodfellowiella coeruleoviolacea]
MDLAAVRTFVAVADAGQFQLAADDLAITQQAASKRVAALEADLGVRLFTRTPRGARLTTDGRAFLPHARALLQAEEHALASVRPGRRALRVDVIGSRVAPAALLRDFHRAHPEIELDVVMLFDADTAISAVRDGTVDATIRAVADPQRQLPDGVASARVLDEALDLLVGPGHEFAHASALTPARLAGHRVWMPGHVRGTEWAAYYEDLAATFGFTIDASGPHFGIEHLMDTIAESPTLSTFAGEWCRPLWPPRHDLRYIPLRDPTPAYPHSLVWHRDNPHPALVALRQHLRATPALETPKAG